MDQFVMRALINSRSAVIEERGQGVGMLLRGWKRMMSTAKKPWEVAEIDMSDIRIPPKGIPMPKKGLAYVQYYSKKGRGHILGRYLPKAKYTSEFSDKHLPKSCFVKPKHLPKFDEERAKWGPIYACYDYIPPRN